MNLLADILAETAPKATTLEVSALGRVYRFRTVDDYSELYEMKREATAFAKKMTENCPGNWAKIAPTSPEVACMVFFMAATSEDPQMTQEFWLTIAKHRAGLFETIFTRLEAELQFNFVGREADLVDAEKKDSKATSNPE
ncbi:MAG: hypothetical protein EBR82_34090 [Caulobacteraceae bacterium]|nr:hypothetical protein [Caulobacteraceae bacterium]NDG19309.1 hypothetical protein [Betaproteobacteria bacterium]